MRKDKSRDPRIEPQSFARRGAIDEGATARMPRAHYDGDATDDRPLSQDAGQAVIVTGFASNCLYRRGENSPAGRTLRLRTIRIHADASVQPIMTIGSGPLHPAHSVELRPSSTEPVAQGRAIGQAVRLNTVKRDPRSAHMADENLDGHLNDGEEFEEITSDEVDRVVEQLEKLIESVSSENIKSYLEEAANNIFFLLYDEEDRADAA
jgi:hypothetical protein